MNDLIQYILLPMSPLSSYISILSSCKYFARILPSIVNHYITIGLSFADFLQVNYMPIINYLWEIYDDDLIMDIHRPIILFERVPIRLSQYISSNLNVSTNMCMFLFEHIDYWYSKYSLIKNACAKYLPCAKYMITKCNINNIYLYDLFDTVILYGNRDIFDHIYCDIINMANSAILAINRDDIYMATRLLKNSSYIINSTCIKSIEMLIVVRMRCVNIAYSIINGHNVDVLDYAIKNKYIHVSESDHWLVHAVDSIAPFNMISYICDICVIDPDNTIECPPLSELAVIQLLISINIPIYMNLASTVQYYNNTQHVTEVSNWLVNNYTCNYKITAMCNKFIDHNVDIKELWTTCIFYGNLSMVQYLHEHYDIDEYGHDVYMNTYNIDVAEYIYRNNITSVIFLIDTHKITVDVLQIIYKYDNDVYKNMYNKTITITIKRRNYEALLFLYDHPI